MLADERAAPLGGEADPNSWHFTNAEEEGPLPNPVGHTFPLLSHNPSGRWELVGTAFYVSSDGLFVTARHNICHVLRDGSQVAPLVIVHPRSSSGLFGPSEVLFRPIIQCWLSNHADIAFGVAAGATNSQTGEMLRHWCWELSCVMPKTGTQIGTYAFPRHVFSADGKTVHFHPDLYLGRILEHGEYRDRVMLPFPYLAVDCRIHGAASGGPIFTRGGKVIGVNCTELTSEHSPGPGYGVQMQCLKNAYIDDAMLAGDRAPRRIAFRELASAKCIQVDDLVGGNVDLPLSGYLVRLNQVQVTAPHPQVCFVQSC